MPPSLPPQVTIGLSSTDTLQNPVHAISCCDGEGLLSGLGKLNYDERCSVLLTSLATQKCGCVVHTIKPELTHVVGRPVCFRFSEDSLDPRDAIGPLLAEAVEV